MKLERVYWPWIEEMGGPKMEYKLSFRVGGLRGTLTYERKLKEYIKNESGVNVGLSIDGEEWETGPPVPV